MPLLDELYSRYQRVGFNLLGVNIDDDSSRAMDMINELGVSFPVLFDATKEVSRLYQVDAMPVTVIVDREGNVRHVHQGYKPGYEDKCLEQVRDTRQTTGDIAGLGRLLRDTGDNVTDGDLCTIRHTDDCADRREPAVSS